MRYYYTDPLKAAFMSREFGISFIDDDGWDYSRDYNKYGILNFIDCNCGVSQSELMKADKASPSREKFYVHHDCEELLEPRNGDAVAHPTSGNFYLLRAGGEDAEWANKLKVEIIRRDGKAFFMPEVCDLEI